MELHNADIDLSIRCTGTCFLDSILMYMQRIQSYTRCKTLSVIELPSLKLRPIPIRNNIETELGNASELSIRLNEILIPLAIKFRFVPVLTPV